jgi:hypothetical protein
MTGKAMLLKLMLMTRTLLPLNLAGTFSPLDLGKGTFPVNAQLRRLSVGLTSAQLLALFTTPVTIVPAPGVGFTIVPTVIVITFVGGSVAYLNGGGGASSFTLGGLSLAVGGAEAIWLVTVSPNRKQQVLPWAGTTDTAASPPAEDNAPLQLSKATANFTAGNGVAQVTAYYTIEPTT